MRVAQVLFGCCLLIATGLSRVETGGAAAQAARIPAYVCPMHSDIRTADPGTCRRCGMVLVPIDPLDVREYILDVETTPSPVVHGRPFQLRLSVRDPDTRDVVRDFAVVHEKRFHLFVISQDLEHYDHVHPQQQMDGTWTLDVTVPRAGFYKLYADFLPDGGTPQIIPRPLVTGGYAGDLASAGAHLVPDRDLVRTVASMQVELTLPHGGLKAGREEKLFYTLTDAATGAPVTDVEPYLGAWGHSLVMSEDAQQFIHAHPIETLPETAGTGGGPRLTFKALLPKPGNYRVWTQIKRRGEVSTAMFTVAAASPSTSSPDQR
jgi:hypothetical protein